MNTTGSRVCSRVAGVVFSLLVLAAISPSAAVGAPLGSVVNPGILPPLPWAVEQTATAFDTGGEGLYYEYFYVMALRRGQTVRFTATIRDPQANVIAYPTFASSACPVSHQIASGAGWTTQSFRVMASRTATYHVAIEAEKVATFTLNAVAAPAMPFQFRELSVPSKARKLRPFRVTVKLVPMYNGFDDPVQFQIKRRSGAKWVWYRQVRAAATSYYPAAYSKYRASLRLPRGTFRIKAVFSDAAHPHKMTSVWKRVKVK